MREEPSKGRERFDLDEETRRALEFDELLEWVASLASTPLGRRAVLRRRPSTDGEHLRDELAEVEEVRRFFEQGGALLEGALPDPSAALGRLAVTGSVLESEGLRGLALVLDAASRVRRSLLGLADEGSPRLARLGSMIPAVDRPTVQILRCIEPDGRLRDEASRQLARIRVAARHTASRIRGLLEGLLHGEQTADAMQDDFITRRGGRFVIPVRSDAPQAPRGIVHALSSSGATRFVEPFATVELNNELVRWTEKEQEEEQRVLARWCDELRSQMPDVRRAVQGLSRVDDLQARARFASNRRAVTPTLDEQKGLLIRAARHPMLDRRLEERGETCVPLDLAFDPADRVVVLSGPNAGGKTVALKTLGLAVLMAQSGIPVPAEELRLPLYRQLRADIGDHQSIEADLSTFSAHVRAAASFVREAAPPALLLFDEIGTGTEPREGGALARAILETLRRPGLTVVATTHLGEVKTWAFASPDALSAAMEFDHQTLRPTYRVRMGIAGVSAGLAIAARHGLPQEIVERARTGLGEDRLQSEELLQRLGDLTRQAERRLESLQLRETELEQEGQRRIELAERKEAERGERARRRLESALAALLARADREIASLSQGLDRRRREREQGRVQSVLRSEYARQQQKLELQTGREVPEGWQVPQFLEEGMPVFVVSLAREGRVQRVRGTKIDVLLGRLTFTVEHEDLRVPAGQASALAAAEITVSTQIAGRGRDEELVHEASREIDLRGRGIQEALAALDKFLDAAALAALDEVRVIHGHGTGRLREAVREFLRHHALVRCHRRAEPAEGGDGATVVQLA